MRIILPIPAEQSRYKQQRATSQLSRQDEMFTGQSRFSFTSGNVSLNNNQSPQFNTASDSFQRQGKRLVQFSGEDGPSNTYADALLGKTKPKAQVRVSWWEDDPVPSQDRPQKSEDPILDDWEQGVSSDEEDSPKETEVSAEESTEQWKEIKKKLFKKPLRTPEVKLGTLPKGTLALAQKNIDMAQLLQERGISTEGQLISRIESIGVHSSRQRLDDMYNLGTFFRHTPKTYQIVAQAIFARMERMPDLSPDKKSAVALGLAKLAAAKNAFDDAEQYVHLAMKHSSKNTPALQWFTILLDRQGRYKEREELLQALASHKDPDTAVTALITLSHYAKGTPDQGRYLQAAQQRKGTSIVPKIELLLARSQAVEDPDQQRVLLDQASKALGKSQSSLPEADFLYLKARLLCGKGYVGDENNIHLFKEALAVLSKRGMAPGLQAEIHVGLGNAYAAKDDNVKAAVEFNNALKIDEDYNKIPPHTLLRAQEGLKKLQYKLGQKASRK